MKNNYRTVIIEDEYLSARMLKGLLEDFVPEVKYMGSAKSVKEGVQLIKSVKPDLVFLDVEINGGTGFDILEKVEDVPFAVIFTTGYDHYTLPAIKSAALDYLLKPILIEDLQRAVQRMGTIKSLYLNRYALPCFKDRQDKMVFDDRILISSSKSNELVLYKNLIRISAFGNYTKFFLGNSRIIVSSKTLSYYNNILNKEIFFRIHKSHIVNLSYIENICSGRSSSITIKGGEEVPLAARRKPDLMRIIKSRLS